ncbi:MAG: helix-turn-helix transcriptional regulator [Clostridia bacterium]|nr:helix-turn-helix transcriptional regulator [Clostridia bacterium]
MNTKEAVAARIVELCRENNIATNALANLSGVSPSTVYSMLNEKSQNPGIVSLKKLCDGFDITLREFFNSPIFDDLEQEIK